MNSRVEITKNVGQGPEPPVGEKFKDQDTKMPGSSPFDALLSDMQQKTPENLKPAKSKPTDGEVPVVAKDSGKSEEKQLSTETPVEETIETTATDPADNPIPVPNDHKVAVAHVAEEDVKGLLRETEAKAIDAGSEKTAVNKNANAVAVGEKLLPVEQLVKGEVSGRTDVDTLPEAPRSKNNAEKIQDLQLKVKPEIQNKVSDKPIVEVDGSKPAVSAKGEGQVEVEKISTPEAKAQISRTIEFGKFLVFQEDLNKANAEDDLFRMENLREAGKETRDGKESISTVPHSKTRGKLGRILGSLAKADINSAKADAPKKSLDAQTPKSVGKDITPPEQKSTGSEQLRPVGGIETMVRSERGAQVEVSKQQSFQRSEKLRQKPSLLKRIKGIQISKSTTKPDQSPGLEPKHIRSDAAIQQTIAAKHSFSDEMQLHGSEVEAQVVETSESIESSQREKSVFIKTDSPASVMSNSSITPKNSITSGSNVRVLSNLISQKIQEITDSAAQASTREVQTKFLVDGGKLGSLDIEFNADDVRQSITITVDSELSKNDLQRITPQIQDNLARKGMDISGLKVEVRDSEKDDNRDRETHNSGSFTGDASTQEPEKQSMTRRYGYNTMEVLA